MLIPLLIALLALGSCDTPAQQTKRIARTYPMTMAVPSSGPILAVGTTGGSLWLVDTAKNIVSPRVSVGGCGIYSICFSPDGMRVAVGTLSNEFVASWTLVEATAAPTSRPLELQDRIGLSARFRPDGARLVLFTHDGGMSLVDCTTGGCIKVPAPSPNRITSACWWNDDKLITGESNGVLRVRSGEDGAMLTSMPPLDDGIDCIEVSIDRRQVLTTFGEKARIWSLPDWNLDSEFKGQYYLYTEGDGMFEAAWSSDRVLIALGTMYAIECHRRDGSLAWVHQYNGGHSVRLLCSFDPTEKYASCARNGGLEGRVFDAATGQRVTAGILEHQRADAIVWTADAKSVAMLDRADGSITVADTSKFERRFVLTIDDRGELTLAK